MQIHEMFKICLEHFYKQKKDSKSSLNLSMIEQLSELIGQLNDLLPDFILPLDCEMLFASFISDNHTDISLAHPPQKDDLGFNHLSLHLENIAEILQEHHLSIIEIKIVYH